MSLILHNLVQRGYEANQNRYTAVTADKDVATLQLPAWGIASLWVTALLYFAITAAVSLEFIARIKLLLTSTARSDTPMAPLWLPLP